MRKKSWLPIYGRTTFIRRILLTMFILTGLLFSSFSLASAEPGKSDISHEASPPIRFAPVAAPVHPNRPGQGATTTSVLYPPSQIQSAYNINTSTFGGGNQAIAIIDAYGDPTIDSDIAVFDVQWGLPGANIVKVYPDGQPTTKNSNWAIETALDVEWAHANAPGATIYLIIEPDATFAHLLNAVNAASQLPVSAISMSWGASESSFTSSYISQYESAFATARSKGIILLASSGDSGAYNGTHPKRLTLNYPASSPQVVSVGGTTLTQNSSTLAWGEKAWSGSGGGYSSLFSEPQFQIDAGLTGLKGRGSPDVSFDADPNTGVYVYSNGSWYGVGGTSVGAPNWAAIVADYAAAKGSNGLNLSLIYGDYTSNSANNYFRDVISGSNGYYSAGTGWDPTTGVGSPIVANLLK